MGIVEELSGRAINRGLQMATANIDDQQYKDMIELLYETGGTLRDMADILADRKLSPEEIDDMVRGVYAGADRIQLEALKSALDRIISGITK
jgi:hypothetical protein